ncbi:MAG: TfoX/Sxy family DNA transformation protein [Myxococcota bacterium]
MNISDKTGAWLRNEGICTHGDLVEADLIALWFALKSQHAQVTRLMYYALWGAVRGLHWNKIPLDEKERIGRVIEAAKQPK